MKYAYILNADEEDESNIVKHEDYDNFDAAAVAHKYGPDKAQRIIPIVKLDDPAYDAATQRLGPRVVTVEADRVTWQKSVVDIPQDELDEIAEKDTIKTWYQTFKDGNATNLQAQRAIARWIKDTYGN